MSISTVYVPPVPPDRMIGELRNILLAGIARNPAVKLCNDSDAADYVLLDFRHLEDGVYYPEHQHKTVIVDYRDPPGSVFPHDSFLYFKRSVVNREYNGFQRYDRDVIPIAYCVRNVFLGKRPGPGAARDIDVSVFFDASETPENARNYYRTQVARFVRNAFDDSKVFVGIAGVAGREGRNTFQHAYFSIMSRSKIVVTCNPDRWEGDYRLFEALSSGALVLSDRMLTPVTNPFIGHRHLVYYDRDRLDTLSDAIEGLLADDAKRTAIADAGYEHAMRFHTAVSRIDEILEQAGKNK